MFMFVGETTAVLAATKYSPLNGYILVPLAVFIAIKPPHFCIPSELALSEKIPFPFTTFTEL